MNPIKMDDMGDPKIPQLPSMEARMSPMEDHVSAYLSENKIEGQLLSIQIPLVVANRNSMDPQYQCY